MAKKSSLRPSNPSTSVLQANLSRLQTSISSYSPNSPSSVFTLARALSLYERQIDLSHRRLSFYPLPQSSSLQARAEDLLQLWRKSLSKGDKISVPDYIDEYEHPSEKWVKVYNATVIQYKADGTIQLGDSSVQKKRRYELKDGEAGLLVHYDGYPSWQKQWFVSTDKYIVPKNCHEDSVLVLEKAVENMTKKAGIDEEDEEASIETKDTLETKEEDDSEMENDGSGKIDVSDNGEEEEANNIEEDKKEEEISMETEETPILIKRKRKRLTYVKPTESKESKSPKKIDRKRKKSTPTKPPTPKPKPTKKTPTKKSLPTTPTTPTPQKTKNTKTPTPTPKKKTKTSTDHDNSPSLGFTWICTLCREAESEQDPLSPLLLCEGPCQRPFHVPCVNLSCTPAKDETWICPDCLQKKHQCAICHEYGEDNVDVFQCQTKNCGLFFHENCLTMYGVEAAEPGEISCPAHRCWTCSDWMTEEKTVQKNTCPTVKREMLYKCLDCPISYHLSCIPPKARFHELALLCHEHRRNKLPDLELEGSLQAEVEEEAEAKIQKYRKKRGKVFKKEERINMKRKKDFTRFLAGWEEAGEFRLPVDFKSEVEKKPPSYTHIHVNQYDPSNRPKRFPPENTLCHCKISCGPSCLNHQLLIECVSNGAYTNCSVGPSCGNRVLTKRQFPKCRPKREKGRGWGLVTLQEIYQGALVQEYVGDIIDEKTMEDRLHNWGSENPVNNDFYVMKLMPGWFIDARSKGSLSRFINHSCDPNCQLKKINVGGYMRIGIVAMRDISPGEYLSYDYRFDTEDGNKFICRCGAKNCRGTLKDPKETKKKDLLLEKKSAARIRFEKDLKFLEKVMEDEKKRLNLTGVTGSNIGNDDEDEEEVKNCECILWRNVNKGKDFSLKEKRWKEGVKAKNKMASSKPKSAVDVLSILEK